MQGNCELVYEQEFSRYLDDVLNAVPIFSLPS